MAGSLREAFAVAGIEVGPELEPASDDGADSQDSSEGWGWRFGIPEVQISRHAAQRYRERFGNRGDSLDRARDQLRARLDYGVVTYSSERPSWLVIVPGLDGQSHDNSAGFLIVDDEMLLPIRKGTSRSHPYYAVTCIARDWI